MARLRLVAMVLRTYEQFLLLDWPVRLRRGMRLALLTTWAVSDLIRGFARIWGLSHANRELLALSCLFAGSASWTRGTYVS